MTSHVEKHLGAGFKLCSPAEVDEMFKQQYGSMFSAAAPLAPLLKRGELVMGTSDVLVRMLLNLKNIYTGLRQADKVLQITEYLRLALKAYMLELLG